MAVGTSDHLHPHASDLRSKQNYLFFDVVPHTFETYLVGNSLDLH